MARLVERYRAPLVVVALFVVPLVVYRAHAVNPRDANVVDRILLLVTTPVEWLVSASTELVSERWYSYVDVVGARRDNVDLRRRVLRLERLAGEAETLEAENARLRRLLLLRERNPKLDTLAATIIAAGASPLHRIVRIDRGLGDGVQRGMAVIADEGVVGRVQRVGYRTAEVLLVVDEKVSLDVVLARSRARGRMTGRGLADRPSMSVQVARAADVEVDDRLVTSGLAGVFPAGVPVGVVVGLAPAPGKNEVVAEVAPAVDFGRLEHVLVVLGGSRPDEPIETPPALLPEALRPAGVVGSTTATTAGAPE